jgi:hypothetical protein
MAQRSESITLIISGEVTVSRLLAAGESILKILREVEHGLVGRRGKDPVRWIVSGAKKSSPLELRFTGQMVNPRDPVALVPETVETVVAGIRAIARRAHRPRYFTDTALEEAKTLANLASISLKNGAARPASLSRKVAEHIDELIGPKISSVGTVVGRLEGLTIHGKKLLVVYEQLTGRRVNCVFPDHMLEQALRGFNNRVSVYGTIHSRATGEKLSVDVEEMEIFPPDSALPKAEDVRGILSYEK